MTGTRIAMVGAAVLLSVVPVAVASPSAASTPRPYFPRAEWLWEPITPNPKLHANTRTWAQHLSQGNHTANIQEYGVTIIPRRSITKDTPRHTISLTRADWGNPLQGHLVPIPNCTTPPPLFTRWGDPGDGHVTVVDPRTRLVYSLWQTRKTVTNTGIGWSASYAGVASLDGDGTEHAGSSTATNISRLAGVIRGKELKRAVRTQAGLGHTLIFSTDMSAPTFVYPARATDGKNPAGVPTPLPQGSRIQLDPTVNVNRLPNLTVTEQVIARTLQTHGAVLGDSGGSRVGFVFERRPRLYRTLGVEDYQQINLPWNKLRVLNSWNGQ